VWRRCIGVNFVDQKSPVVRLAAFWRSQGNTVICCAYMFVTIRTLGLLLLLPRVAKQYKHSVIV